MTSSSSTSWQHIVRELAADLRDGIDAAQQRVDGRGQGQGRHRRSARSLTPAQSEHLVSSWLWVILGLRDAVLLDQVRLPPARQRLILHALNAPCEAPSWQRRLPRRYSCFLRHHPSDQLFLISRAGVQARARSTLQDGDTTHDNHDVYRPRLVDVRAGVAPGTSCSRLYGSLRSAIEALTELGPEGDVTSTIYELSTPASTAVGLAGWLLGYAVIYHFGDSMEESVEDHASTRAELRRVPEHDKESTLLEEEAWDEALPNNLGGVPLVLFQATLVTRQPAHATDPLDVLSLFAFSTPASMFDREDGISLQQVRQRVEMDLERRRLGAVKSLTEVESDAPVLDALARVLGGACARVSVSEVSLPLVAL